MLNTLRQAVRLRTHQLLDEPLFRFVHVLSAQLCSVGLLGQRLLQHPASAITRSVRRLQTHNMHQQQVCGVQEEDDGHDVHQVRSATCSYSQDFSPSCPKSIRLAHRHRTRQILGCAHTDPNACKHTHTCTQSTALRVFFLYHATLGDCVDGLGRTQEVKVMVAEGDDDAKCKTNAPDTLLLVADSSLSCSHVLLQVLLVLHGLIKLLLKALSPALPHRLSLKL